MLINSRPPLSVSTRGMLAVISLIALAVSVYASQSQPNKAASRITTASGVRVRSAPQTTADEVAKLPIGVVFPESEHSDKKENINGVEDFWYRVKTDDGKEGWVFGGFTAPVNTAGLAPAYRKIANDRLKVENLSPNDLLELAEFIARITDTVTAPEMKAELELDRLLAIKKMLASIMGEKASQAPFQQWIKEHDNQIAYSEPSGQWLVRSNLFWDLQKQNAKLPIAELIAWEAAENPLPGECEGFLECDLGEFNMTNGRYLELYPHGAHVNEALDHLEETLKSAIQNMKEANGIQPGDIPELKKELAKVRATVTKTTSAKKTSILSQLDQIAQHYR